MKTHRSSARWRDVAHYKARRDHAGERTVEAALDLQRHCGTAYAAQYMHANDVALHVALRALTRPAQRRIVGVVLNGPSIAQALAANNPAALNLFHEAAAHLVEGGIAVNGMAFGRQEQMTGADDIRAWLSTLRRPNHARACLDTPTLEQS